MIKYIKTIYYRFKVNEEPKVIKPAIPQPIPIVKKKPVTMFDKYFNYVDNLLGMISLWISLILFVYVYKDLPDLKWPYHLDELVFLVLLYILIDVTIKKLRPVVFVALTIGIIYLVSEIVLDVYKDSINPTKTTQTIKIGDADKLIPALHKIINPESNTANNSAIDSLKVDNMQLKLKLLELEHRMDSFNLKIK